MSDRYRLITQDVGIDAIGVLSSWLTGYTEPGPERPQFKVEGLDFTHDTATFRYEPVSPYDTDQHDEADINGRTFKITVTVEEV